MAAGRPRPHRPLEAEYPVWPPMSAAPLVEGPRGCVCAKPSCVTAFVDAVNISHTNLGSEGWHAPLSTKESAGQNLRVLATRMCAKRAANGP